jgi:hypothetical protein
MNNPLKFFKATVKSNFVYIGGEYLLKGHPLSVARWGAFYVVALNDKTFSILSEEDASIHLQTKRINGKLTPAKPLNINPNTSNKFKYTITAGYTCPDGCCGEDSPYLTEVLTSKEDAIKHASSLASGEFGGPLGFVNVHGPGYHSRKWNAPPRR